MNCFSTLLDKDPIYRHYNTIILPSRILIAIPITIHIPISILSRIVYTYPLGGTQYPIPLGSGSEECQKD